MARSPWNLVNYQEFGFIKRGFIGTILTGLGIPVTKWTLVFLGTGFGFGVFVMAMVFFRWATQSVGRHTPFVRNLAILCVLSPVRFCISVVTCAGLIPSMVSC